jgi:hypothetical protein
MQEYLCYRPDSFLFDMINELIYFFFREIYCILLILFLLALVQCTDINWKIHLFHFEKRTHILPLYLKCVTKPWLYGNMYVHDLNNWVHSKLETQVWNSNYLVKHTFDPFLVQINKKHD